METLVSTMTLDSTQGHSSLASPIEFCSKPQMDSSEGQMALGSDLQHLLRRKVSWGDGSVDKVLAVRTRDLVRIPNTHVKKKKNARHGGMSL